MNKIETETEPNSESFPINAMIVGRLSIERCQAHVAHLHALMHLCEPASIGKDGLVTESILRIMAHLESDLSHSARAMSYFI